MVKVVEEIKIEMPPAREYARVGKFFDGLSQSQQDRFMSEWRALEENGAQMADVGFCYGVIHCWISDDFRQHCRKWGLEI